MSIIYLSENSQASILSTYNAEKTKFEKIPLVPRNLKSGWPLLQVSFFSVVPNSSNPIKYEPALGGGKCHVFYVGAFCLAGLLSKVPGKVMLNDKVIPEEDKYSLSLSNVEGVLDEFTFKHVHSGIEIIQGSGGYGKTLEVKIPEGDSVKLRRELSDTFDYALKNGRGLRSFGNYQNNIRYTEEEIKNRLKTEAAIFQSGQVYIDLGMFLEEIVKDNEITDLFKQMFKVDEFLEIAAQQDIKQEIIPVVEHITLVQDIKQDMIPVVEQITSSPKANIESIKVNLSIELQKTLSQIDAMRSFGDQLKNKDFEKGTAVIQLANQLETKIKGYYVARLEDGLFYENDIKKLNSEFIQLLHEQDEKMSAHRESWKPIFLNVFIGLTVIGALAIAIKTILHVADAYKNNEKISMNKALFFATTQSEKQIESIEKSFQSEIRSIPVKK